MSEDPPPPEETGYPEEAEDEEGEGEQQQYYADGETQYTQNPEESQQHQNDQYSDKKSQGSQGEDYQQEEQYDQGQQYDQEQNQQYDQGQYYPQDGQYDDQGQYQQYPDQEYNYGNYQNQEEWRQSWGDQEYFGDNWGWEDDQYTNSWRTSQETDTENMYSQEGEDMDLEEADLSQGGNDDTIRSSLGKGEEDVSRRTVPDFDFRSTEPEKKRFEAVEISTPTLRWFARKIMYDHIPTSDENLRRRRLLEKCQIVRKVSKPVLTIFGGKTKQEDEIKPEAGPAPPSERESKLSVFGEDDEQEETTVEGQTFREFTDKEWAMKQTLDYLTKEGCSSSSGRSYDQTLKEAREDADFRLDLYEKQLEKRRGAIGGPAQAPEITASFQRHAERAVWRAVIDNTKPRYPLPRFIIPRHKYLKKVQAQFIGPGSYEHDVYEAQQKFRRMRLPSTWATCNPRFPKEKSEGKNVAEGTGLLDPWVNLDKANYKKKNPGIYIPFESTPKNFRKGMALSGSGVPPDAYNIKSPLEEFVKKKTGLRGPYDCYTPSRSIIPYGYYKTENDEEKCRLGPGSYEIRTSLVKEMQDSYHFFKGPFGKADRRAMFGFKAAFENPLWPKENPGIPPVGEYNPEVDSIGSDRVQNHAPFKVQAGFKKKTKKKVELVAPDYYYFGLGTTWTVPPKGANLASAFKSRSPQTMPAKDHQVRKERNKPINWKIDLDGGGHTLETHYAFDENFKKQYALEDCKDPCFKRSGGPVKDPYAIPGYGVINVPGPGGKIVEKCCNCG